jgi:hypothetical protein
MAAFALSNREKNEAVRSFYAEHPFNLVKSSTTRDISELSFKDFCRLVNRELTKDQVILSKLIDIYPAVICVASHGVGKSFFAAMFLAWKVICHDALVVVTAPTQKQVKNIIWRNVNEMFNQLKKVQKLRTVYGVDLEKDYAIGHTFLRELDVATKNENKFKLWYEQDNTSSNQGKTYKKDADSLLGYAFGQVARSSDEFQGLHASGYFYIVVDEASGVNSDIIEGAISCLTAANNHLLMIGNPISRGNKFEEMAKNVGCFKMLPFTHPNVEPYYQKLNGRWILTDKSCLEQSWVAPVDGAVTPKWIEGVKEKYGENSLYYQTRVLAQFPQLGSMAGVMFGDRQINHSNEFIDLPSNVLSSFSYLPLYVGVDVGESQDPTVVSVGHLLRYSPTEGAPMQELLIVRSIHEIESDGRDFLQQKRNLERLQEIIGGYLVTSRLNDKDVTIALDSTGLGVALLGLLADNTTYTLIPCHFNAAANSRKTFTNLRAEIFWSLRDRYISNTINIYGSVSDDVRDQVAYELPAIRYVTDTNDRIQIIPKEDIKNILGVSPNFADSLALLSYGADYSEGIIRDETGKPANS